MTSRCTTVQLSGAWSFVLKQRRPLWITRIIASWDIIVWCKKNCMRFELGTAVSWRPVPTLDWASKIFAHMLPAVQSPKWSLACYAVYYVGATGFVVGVTGGVGSALFPSGTPSEVDGGSTLWGDAFCCIVMFSINFAIASSRRFFSFFVQAEDCLLWPVVDCCHMLLMCEWWHYTVLWKEVVQTRYSHRTCLGHKEGWTTIIIHGQSAVPHIQSSWSPGCSCDGTNAFQSYLWMFNWL
jgi:hypothetical protein